MSCIARFTPDGPLTSNNDWELTFHLARLLEDGSEAEIDVTGATVTAAICEGTEDSRGPVVLEAKELEIINAETGEVMLPVSHIENGPTEDPDTDGWKGQYVLDVLIVFAGGEPETCGPVEFDVRRPITVP